MLVFQRNFDHIEDGCNRAEIDPKWLIEVVDEIKLYLPDDWRMTRTKNNFMIKIVAEHNVTLVGYSYRAKDNVIINIIDTVFLKDYFDQHDLRASLVCCL
ncbi:MAG: hypothetical protein IBX72_09835 [Nitrospirae bacterium]|nr:hypothetical protein [Nitrospirota bacterium]